MLKKHCNSSPLKKTTKKQKKQTFNWAVGILEDAKEISES